MNNTLSITIAVAIGAVIAFGGILLGVWIAAKFTGAFNTYSSADDPYKTVVGASNEPPEGEQDEYVPWLGDLPNEGVDPGDDPSNWEQA